MLTAVSTRMVADVGGTNTRVALFDPQANAFRALRTYVNRDFTGLQQVLGAWLESLAEPAPKQGCIAVAAPPGSVRVHMVNINWSFSIDELAASLGFERLVYINDFEAIAYALPLLGEDDRHTLSPGDPAAGDPAAGASAQLQTRPLATIGPGTGLGGAVLATYAGQHAARACEPGHMGFSPGNDLELEIFSRLLRRGGRVHTEMLASGPGLARLYETLAEIRGEDVRARTPAAISTCAMEDSDDLCKMALACFCALLGSICGDFTLANGAYGGLYLAGGIVPGIIPFLADSEFHRRFCDKGAMTEYLERVPIHVITRAQPGLLGAAHACL